MTEIFLVKMSDDEESTSGSQSTLFGSVKSSKSSASFFGSCKSTGLYIRIQFLKFSEYDSKTFFRFLILFQTRSEVFIQPIRQVTKAMLQEVVLEQRFLVHVGVQVSKHFLRK